MEKNKIDMSLDEIIHINKIGPFKKNYNKNDSLSLTSSSAASSAASSVSSSASSSSVSSSYVSRQKKNNNKRPIDWDKPNNDNEPMDAQINNNTNAVLIIDNLESNVTDDDLKDLFEVFGDVSRVETIPVNDKTKTGRVYYNRKSDAINAKKEMNLFTLDGRELRMRIESSDGTAIESKVSNIGKRIKFNGNGKNSNRIEWNGKSEKREEKNIPSVEELDAELDDYIANRPPKK